jgi:hypothetical protein
MVVADRVSMRAIAEAKLAEAIAMVEQLKSRVTEATFTDSIVEFLNKNLDIMELPEVDKDVSFRFVYNLENNQFEIDPNAPSRSGGGRRVFDWHRVRVYGKELPIPGEKMPDWEEAIKAGLAPEDITSFSSSQAKLDHYVGLGWAITVDNKFLGDVSPDDIEDDVEEGEDEELEEETEDEEVESTT